MCNYITLYRFCKIQNYNNESNENNVVCAQNK